MNEIQDHYPLSTNEEQVLLRSARHIVSLVERAISNYWQQVAAVRALEQAGISNAAEWWKDAVYLYLVYPTAQDGSRRREYIGKKPEKVAAARARIARYKRHCELVAEANQSRNTLARIGSSLSYYARELDAIEPVKDVSQPSLFEDHYSEPGSIHRSMNMAALTEAIRQEYEQKEL